MKNNNNKKPKGNKVATRKKLLKSPMIRNTYGAAQNNRLRSKLEENGDQTDEEEVEMAKNFMKVELLTAISNHLL